MLKKKKKNKRERERERTVNDVLPKLFAIFIFVISRGFFRVQQ